MKNSTPEIDALTYKIIGCAMKVHSELGNGFQEVIYQRCLAIELTSANLNFEREKEIPIYYHDHHVGTRRVDFLVEGKIAVELKAVEQLNNIHKAQAINYCEAFNIPFGLLINFGETRLNPHRVYNNKLVDGIKET